MRFNHSLIAFTLFLFTLNVSAQNSCSYKLQLFDLFGDGWANSNVEVKIGETSNFFTLDGENDNGVFREFDINIVDNDTITIIYNALGNRESENSYRLFSPEDILVFEDGTDDNERPDTGVVFASRLECPSCLVVNPESVSIDDVSSFFADISWAPRLDQGSVYKIEFGVTGFSLGGGTVVETTNSFIQLQDLAENTTYDFYVSVSCDNNEDSRQIGPYSFTTLYNNNVGVIGIFEPETSCGIQSSDSVKVILKNFGGRPQSLIPFNFTVNGSGRGVSMPTDGLYTGVLGKDSTDIIAFDVTFGTSQSGEYTIQAWTELEEDAFTANDTFTVTITNIPIVTNYPYTEDFEDWKGGWLVGDLSQNSTWSFGKPSGLSINSAASGSNAWVTNLSGPYNDDEFSTLVSPCLDFSNLDMDPRLSFSLNFDSEECCDEGWVEVSIDDGETWTKVGTANSGFNWYNNGDENWWSGDGGFSEWVTSFNTLQGTANQPNVRVRFVFSSDGSTVAEGLGIDDIFIATVTEDLGAVRLNRESDEECGVTNDQLTMVVGNFGQEPVLNPILSYQINGGPIVHDTLDTSINPSQEITYTFEDEFDTSVFGRYEIKAWTNLPMDDFIANDTATLIFNTAVTIPFEEDFESSLNLPEGWDASPNAVITDEHGNQSLVLSYNLWFSDTEFEYTTPVIGPIVEGDSLVFDYRIVDLDGDGEVATELVDDVFRVEISTDCGLSYETVITIDSSNHTPSNQLQEISLLLNEYVGTYIKIRFTGLFGGEGDYYFDLDNVFIPKCTGSLDIIASVQGTSDAVSEDGRISVTPNAGGTPYTYMWNTGAVTSTIENLPVGSYQVTVTDRFGCTDVFSTSLNVIVNTNEVNEPNKISIYPNPTNDFTTVDLELSKLSDVQIFVYDLLGRQMFSRNLGPVQSTVQNLDVSNLNEGIYLILLQLDGKMVQVERFVKQSK